MVKNTCTFMNPANLNLFKMRNKPADCRVGLIGGFSGVMSLFAAWLEMKMKKGVIKPNLKDRNTLFQQLHIKWNICYIRYLSDWDGVSFKGGGAAATNTSLIFKFIPPVGFKQNFKLDKNNFSFKVNSETWITHGSHVGSL